MSLYRNHTKVGIVVSESNSCLEAAVNLSVHLKSGVFLHLIIRMIKKKKIKSKRRTGLRSSTGVLHHNDQPVNQGCQAVLED